LLVCFEEDLFLVFASTEDEEGFLFFVAGEGFFGELFFTVENRLDAF
jgi:hypothetical protein